METVVDEKPLSFATSLIVTVSAFIARFSSLARIAMNHRGLNSCCCWRTLQQRVKAVSSATMRFLLMFLWLAAAQAASATGMQQAQTRKPGSAPATQSVDPQQAGAYANLGVIDMRRKQWPQALEMLHKAEHLAPQIAGIRLNIGLVYYRQNDFRNAIPPFESVVHDAPDSFQARYLLGLCYFFLERYGDAASTLEPLWSQASGQLNYLYVLGIAANKAGRADLEQRALSHLVEIGQNSPEFHLLMGKAHLNREEYDEAITELELAVKKDSSLPFVHFNLGMAYQ